MAATRKIALRTNIASGKLRLKSMTAVEALGRPYGLDFELESREGSLSYNEFLGQQIAAEFEIGAGKMRYWHGLVHEVEQIDQEKGWCYRVHAVPWLYLLTHAADIRVFQGKTVPDIIKQVFRDRGFSDFEDTLHGTYGTRVYCVQYRETDFNFVSRLMEEEGIYYYFKHDADRHVLVLADGQHSHEPVSGYSKIPYYPSGSTDTHGEEHIHEWTTLREFTSGKYVLNDFDFQRPSASLVSPASQPGDHAHGALEVYDYHANFTKSSDGDRYAKLRLQEQKARYARSAGEGHVRGIQTGSLFTFGADAPEPGSHPRSDQNKEYLVVAARHRLVAPEASSGGTPEDDYTVHFEAIESSVPYRHPRETPKPVIQGPQTAIVVGASGDEIGTEENARIKVQFHWDRVGKNDQDSSAWVRVAQLWAGNGFGAQFLPRIGDEVIVIFIEGDPDYPIVVGSVYNGTNKPPYSLPGDKTKSGIRTRSSLQGGADNCSELTFDDKKGSEMVLLHAEKDLTVEVEHDESRKVDNNRTTKVGADDTESVKGKQAIDVGKTYALTATDEISLESGQSKIVMKKDGTIQITGMKITIDASDELKAHGMKVTVNADTTLEAKGLEVKASADTQMTLQAQTQMNIKGLMVTIEGQVQTQVKGTMLDLKGTAMAQLGGGITMIG